MAGFENVFEKFDLSLHNLILNVKIVRHSFKQISVSYNSYFMKRIDER